VLPFEDEPCATPCGDELLSSEGLLSREGSMRSIALDGSYQDYPVGSYQARVTSLPMAARHAASSSLGARWMVPLATLVLAGVGVMGLAVSSGLAANLMSFDKPRGLVTKARGQHQRDDPGREAGDEINDISAIDLQVVTLELVWSDSLGRCLTVDSIRNVTGIPITLQQCQSSNAGQRFSLDSALVRWELHPQLCLALQSSRDDPPGIVTQLCSSRDGAQQWELQRSSPHPVVDTTLCIEGTREEGARAALVPCSSTRAPTPRPTPAATPSPNFTTPAPPTPAPTPEWDRWHCHHYSGTQGNDWCRKEGVRSAIEYKFFGPVSECGKCWCCKRRLEKPDSKSALAWALAVAPPKAATPAPQAATPAPWEGHRYQDGQNTPWCKAAGVQGGFEYRFFGPDSPCGKCWCCKRPHT